MKKTYSILFLVAFLLLIFTKKIQAQGTTCQLATPFCTATGSTFPATTSPFPHIQGQVGIRYGCLIEQRNPAWYVMQINSSGNIVVNVSSSPSFDTDYAIWGPFPAGTDVTNLCDLNLNNLAPNPLWCDYSGNDGGTATLTNVVAGTLYIFLVTNYENEPTQITISQTATSTASTNCTLVASNALDFDGTNDVVNIPTGINLINRSFTVEFWAKRSGTNSEDIVFSQGTASNNNLLKMGFQANNEFVFSFFGNDLTVPATLVDNNWHQWSCVYDAGVAAGSVDRKIYRDGILVASDDSPSNYLGSGQILLGDDISQVATNSLYKGRVDDLRIWATPRSACEILSFKDAHLLGTEPNLIAYYDFDIGVPSGINTGLTTLPNLTALGTTYQGTLSNFALNGATSNWVSHGVTSSVSGDLINPVVTCPANVTANIAGLSCAMPVVNIDALATDNCSVSSLTWTKTGATTGISSLIGINQVSGTNFNVGITTVTYTAKDGNNNSATCSFTVTVLDNILPTLTCHSNVIANTTPTTCNNIINSIDAIFSDNCSFSDLTWAKTGATVGNSPATGINQVSGTNFNVGITTVTYTAKDASNNVTTCSFTVTITDNILPTMTCPANVTENLVTNCTKIISNIDANFVDNCGVITLTWAKTGATITNSPATGINQASNTSFNAGITTVTYTAKDAAGNIATCSFTITIVDNILPTMTCPTNVLNCTNSIAIPILNIDAVFADNCAVILLTWTKTGATTTSSALTGINQASNTTFNIGVTTVTYTAKDAAGNTVICSFDVEQKAMPIAIANLSQSSVCQGDNVTFNTIFAPFGSTYEYTWYENNVVISNLKTFTLLQNVAGTFDYKVKIKDLSFAAGCEMESPVVTLNVDLAPNPAITADGNATVCQGGTRTLQTQIAPIGQTFNYEWFKDGVLMVGQNSFDLIVTQTGEYIVKITTANACSRTTLAPFKVTIIPTTILTINNLRSGYCEKDRAFTPIGNPTGGFFKIDEVAFQPPYLPAQLGVGTHVVRYLLPLPSGCIDSIQQTITIKAAPFTKIDTQLKQWYCVSETASFLNASPLGGTFYVDGNNVGQNNAINSITFNPSAVGVKNKVWIKYVYPSPINGCENADSVFTEIIANPIVNLWADKNLCSNITNVTISALLPSHTNTVNYYWTNLATNAVIGTNSDLTVTTSGTYRVIVTDSRACNPVFDDIVVRFNPLPTVNLGADKTICGSQMVVLKANPNANNIGNFKYLWSDGSTLDSLVMKPDTISGIRTYKVKVTDANFSSNCVSEDEIVINFQKNPTVNLGADRRVCFPNNVPFTVDGFNSNNTALNVSYQWYNLFSTTPTTVLATASNISISEQGLYVLKVTSSSGCSKSDSLQILFDKNPDFKILGNNNNGRCQNLDTLYIQATNALNYDVTWTGAGINQTSADKLQIIVGKSGRYTATIKDKTNYTACETVISVDVFIGDFPKAEISPKVSPKFITVCQDTIITLNAAADTHLASFGYEWRNLNTNQVISNASSLVISYASLGNFERTRFAVKVTPPSGCSSADTISVQFQQKAVAAILPNFPAEICLGESFSLTATGGDVFKWTSSDTEAKLNTTNLQNIKPSKSGTYTYTVEVSFAGSKLCKSTKASVTVKVNEKPIAKLKQKTIRLCQESSVILDATDSTHTQTGGSGSGTNAIRYSWRSLSTNEIVGTSAKNLFTFANAKPQASFNASFYEITVTDIRTGCTAKDTANITFVRKAQPIINKSVRTSICLGDSIRLTASQGDNYRWNTGKFGATIWVKPDSVGLFTYKVGARFDTLCTEGYDSIKIQVNPIPVVKANAVKEINICVGNSATLLATGGIRYEWLSGEKTAKIVVSPLKDTKYIVRTFNEFSCPSKYDTVLVKVTPKSQIPDKFVLCEGDSVVINALNPDASAKYLWNTKDSTASIRVNKAGKYSVTIKVKACEYTLNTEVIIRQRPKIALDTAAILCFAIGNELEQKPYRVHKHSIFGKLLNREAGEIYYYEWYYKNSNMILDNGIVLNDNVIPLEISKLDTSYVLRVRTGTGKICDKFATIRIKTICDARVKVPTAFSPNEDNLNDFFAPVTSDLVGIRLMIFQRWGDIVYEKYINPAENEGWNGVFKENEGWDGTFGGSPAPIDTYQYALVYWSRNQKGELIETKTTGSLVLVRGISR